MLFLLKKIATWIFRAFLYLLIPMIVLALFALNLVDRTPYQEMDYYAMMRKELATLRPDTASASGELLAGWAKRNITPPFKVMISGYGPRDDFKSVRDSVFTRVFVLDNGVHKTALVTVDLLMFPAAVKEQLLAKSAKLGFTEKNLYLSATHTHNGPGGWFDSMAGEIIAGDYNKEYVALIVDKICEALQEASSTKEKCSIGYLRVEEERYVINRIRYDESKDRHLRALYLRKKISGKEAMLVTYAAHANCLESKTDFLSCDYPGVMVNALEKKYSISFAAYFAGAVGSMAPRIPDNAEWTGTEQMEIIGNNLARTLDSVKQQVVLHESVKLYSDYFPVYLREPHLKLGKDIRLRPWVFNLMYGSYKPGIQVLRIGDVIMLGTPCDFSGQLIIPLEKQAEEQGKNLMITSFNGAYIGYINNDEYYDYDSSEPRYMNWFGPYNGAYFSWMMGEVIKKY